MNHTFFVKFPIFKTASRKEYSAYQSYINFQRKFVSQNHFIIDRSFVSVAELERRVLMLIRQKMETKIRLWLAINHGLIGYQNKPKKRMFYSSKQIACVAGRLEKKAKKVEIPSVQAKRLGREEGKTACRKTKLFASHLLL